jgi:hypothetical protein
MASILYLPKCRQGFEFAHRYGVPLCVFVACFFCAHAAYPPGRFAQVLMGARQFAFGEISIDRAYVAQTQWPGRMPSGGIYPGARGAYQIVGPNTPVWTFHVHSYCMLPDCNFQTHAPFIMSRDMDQVLYGSPEQARSVLQDAGMNYFFFSSELVVADFVVGAPLFQPDNIGKYLGVRWTDGKSVLLTWKGDDTRPFEGEILNSYKGAVEVSAVAKSFPWKAMNAIFLRLRSEPHPWKSFPLPWEGNRPY